MKTKINSQSTAAVNSAISNIFSKKSVLDFAVYAYNKMAKSSNGNSDKISVVVGDGYRVTMDCGMDKIECYLVLNMYLEEKIGGRYCRIRNMHTGWMDMANEYMVNGSWKSVVVYTIKDKIESMVEELLNSYTKDNDEYYIKEWEALTGMVYMAPSLNEVPCLDETPMLIEGLIMKKFDKINERTIEAVVGGAVVELGPKAVLKYNDEYVDISYDLDEDKYTMTDDYGNEEEAYYNVEDEDWYLFQESFKDAFADLVAETAKSRVYGNILGPDRYK